MSDRHNGMTGQWLDDATTGTRHFEPGIQERERGDYEKRVGADGQELISGACAGCGARVREGDPHVIRYATDGTPGGIFHNFPFPPFSCAPTGPQWYGVDAPEAREDE